ncbi:hypothetical protein [Ketogulonicigenium vulgare]|uniref:Uncharacterized protein n=1 Tax=Ketogulonicigenium vulgare (strain WSH-001) TaxID=759362 RepID=F9Y9D9_KETVW|nr:hypothetical protein [Ketogulonicigenium vulgare]ADO41897.1 conserved hypothetical protein [Ketogulonicigenium vulgare Y25]AEM40121.1 hypothetical protein KVU_0282 [Ketogulonicigenium vulgare WSH-001]ALJ80327.1 hypothetical protein KVH_03525 [Ketogulonicigenium vulgare]ANW33165.1 hypothetical protein KvSKV_03500 [Ketogulonicigenium vulgare]AOZ53820.1 hypothetical protein KVC_0803 [Ketogulonicigenium vulgare]
MRYASVDHFLTGASAVLAKGPIGIIYADDNIEIDSTISHHLARGPKVLIVFGHKSFVIAPELSDLVHYIEYDVFTENGLPLAVNRLLDAAPEKVWFYYSYNAEYLFHAFSEHRTIAELTTFCAEERRDSVLTYVIDLYPGDLQRTDSGISLSDAYIDRTGYYALGRKDKENNYEERQLDFFGGLRWRFEEYVLPRYRRIDRVSIFRNKRGLQLLPDHRLNIPEYNTYACPWHHSPTAVMASFRTARALRRNPGSRFDIKSFMWHNSVPFTWNSQQLLSLGLMEPGQWF